MELITCKLLSTKIKVKGKKEKKSFFVDSQRRTGEYFVPEVYVMGERTGIYRLVSEVTSACYRTIVCVHVDLFSVAAMAQKKA